MVAGIARVENFLCLVTKQFVYRMRCMRKDLFVGALKKEFRKIESLEKYIAIKNNRLEKHYRKWEKSRDDMLEERALEDLQDFVQQYVQGQ